VPGADANRPAVAVLHAAVPADAPPDNAGVVRLARTVGAVLETLGFEPVEVAAGLDLDALARRLRTIDPLFAFNLVDDLAADGRLIDFVPGLLESMGIAYTGCSRTATLLTSNKPLAKHILAAAGIATPAWIEPRATATAGPIDRPYIVKSAWEHASVGLSEASVVATAAELASRCAELERTVGGEWFAEAYVDGREFNVALLGRAEEPELLPVAEIEFHGYDAGRPRIVDYAAKWEPDSAAYRGTVRALEASTRDRALHCELAAIARSCWNLFGLSGYARVDFRVDQTGRPWVLEVNANPCLDPDAGLAAAAAHAGLGYAELIARIVAARPAAAGPSRRPGSVAGSTVDERITPCGGSPGTGADRRSRSATAA